MFTPNQVYTFVLAACGLITAIAAATAVVLKIIATIHKPEAQQNEKIAELQTVYGDILRRLEKHENHFSRDRARLDRLEFGNEATQEALLALLDHALNENNIDGLKSAKKKLESFLISQKTEIV
jgi:predicted negative regulator of RcsB-dependent stress response